jgi:hypothetical protein
VSEGNHKPYLIVETPQFQEDVKKYMGNFRRWDEVKETIDLDLARKPHLFEQIPETQYRAVTLQTKPLRTLYFSVDDGNEKVILGRLI